MIEELNMNKLISIIVLLISLLAVSCDDETCRAVVFGISGTCSVCSGSGICQSCDGKSFYSSCSSCRGSGKCKNCGGDGKINE